MIIDGTLIGIDLESRGLSDLCDEVVNTDYTNPRKIDSAIKILMKVLKENMDNNPKAIGYKGKKDLYLLLNAAINYDCLFKQIQVSVDDFAV